ncbi:hypothetical protein SELMODRAFT_432600 [Selaginella moellendorffii]|uniref:Uncharacterized protein n=1 Tax=Selaginella moellendorffii TaxID=88036 RepID=D8TGH8_SELML|nr:hypothetical protein SELMODRAFT_432600 [Selaginella moellendorffii]
MPITSSANLSTKNNVLNEEKEEDVIPVKGPILGTTLTSWNDGFKWDPSLRAFRLLKLLADDFTFHVFDRSFITFDELLRHSTTNAEIATTVLRFLLHACSVVYYDLTSEAFDVLNGFCEKLAYRFSNQQLRSAYALSLMALAARLPGASERLANLRNLNSGMQLAETGKGLSIQSLALSTSASATCRSSMLRGMPAECSQLVHSGLAFQVSVDVEKLDKSINLRDVIELANGPINMFFMPHTSRCVEYLDRSLHLICEALKRCERTSFEFALFGRLVVVFGLEDRIIPVALSSLARTLFIEVASKGSLLQWRHRCLIPQMVTSAKLCLLQTLFREFIRLKWPGIANDVDPAAFKELRGLLNWMFSSGALQFNLTDSEEDNKNRPRGFLEQLETVEVGVNVYLLIVWLEVKGGTDYCGWLATTEQEVEITEPLFNNYLTVARSVIEYALLVNSDPQIVIEEGLLPANDSVHSRKKQRWESLYTIQGPIAR